MMEDQPLYKFRWTNVDLRGYAQGLRAKADNLRREAEVLFKRADQIVEISYDIENALVEHDPEKDNQ